MCARDNAHTDSMTASASSQLPVGGHVRPCSTRTLRARSRRTGRAIPAQVIPFLDKLLVSSSHCILVLRGIENKTKEVFNAEGSVFLKLQCLLHWGPSKVHYRRL